MVLLDVELGGEPDRATVLRGLEPVIKLRYGDIVHTGGGSCHLSVLGCALRLGQVIIRLSIYARVVISKALHFFVCWTV